MFSILGTICVGDKTSCGGTVATGSQLSDVNGRAIARKGDKISCRRNCIIAEGNETEIVDGAPMALHGAATSNGCTCLSTLNNVHGDGATEAQRASAATAADIGLAFIPEIADLLTEDQWVEFRLVDSADQPIPDQPFILEGPAGESVSGRLDMDGFARVEPVKPGTCRVYFPELDYSITVSS